MGIEKDIQQGKFKSSHQKAGINIIYTASCIHLHTSHVLKQFDLTPPQFNVLRILRGQFPKAITVNEIINRMLDKSSNASRIVEKLKAKKFIERKECEHDRRQVDVSITEKGLSILSEIDEKENEFVFGNGTLTAAEAETLSELLDKGRLYLENLNNK
jgi:DNA-binding MarR family transcriptional regulator